MSFIIYQVSSNQNPYNYYGYCSSSLNPKQEFLKGATRKDRRMKRGSVDWLDENGGDQDNLFVDIIETCNSEYEAWMMRNDLRAEDIASITGPSIFPIVFNDQTPDDVKEKWKQQSEIKKCKTAFEAYKLKAFTYHEILNLSKKFNRDQIKHDLKELTPLNFSNKYKIEINVA